MALGPKGHDREPPTWVASVERVVVGTGPLDSRVLAVTSLRNLIRATDGRVRVCDDAIDLGNGRSKGA